MSIPNAARASQPHARSLYRSFLRELPLPVTVSSPLHRHLRRTFTGALDEGTSRPSEAQSSATSPTTTSSATSHLDERSQRAEQYLVYLRAQRTYLSLLERYNPGIAMDAGRNHDGDHVEDEDRGRVRATARRVGMVLPDSFPSTPPREGSGEQTG